jgi:hypothetical protein
MRFFSTCSAALHILVIGRTCAKHGSNTKSIHDFCWKILMERDHLRKLGMYERIILNVILETRL